MKINLSNGVVIAGKWWGSKSVRPFICLHGWQDNAGSFDRLIPLLPRHFSYLAIDLPGHGRSTWLPDGSPYNTFDFMYPLYELVKELKFPKIGLIGHSMGSIVAFTFAALFPELVDQMISTDTFKGIRRSLSERVSDLRMNVEYFNTVDKRNREVKTPPVYSIPELITKLYEGSLGNVTLESTPFILRRNVAPSTTPGKFQFTRDGRLRLLPMMPYNEEILLQMAREISSPFLFLIASRENELFEKTYRFDDLIETLEANPHVTCTLVDSDSHYFHLNEPETISAIVSDFIVKNSMKNHL